MARAGAACVNAAADFDETDGLPDEVPVVHPGSLLGVGAEPVRALLAASAAAAPL